MRTGIATIPLDYGKCPYWLFERMKRLSRGIMIAIVEEFGSEEVLKRLADPVWFQSLGCVLGFDFNSSGLTTTVLGALKEGVRGLESDLGVFVCGGKGKTSKKTPQNIEDWGQFLSWPMDRIDKLVYASKMSAKTDNVLLQDGFQLYHHNLIFTKSGSWTVIQQGMSETKKKARRYHWLSWQVKDFVEEPHSGIASQIKVKPLNLTAKKSRNNRQISSQLVKEGPKTFLKDISLIQRKKEGQLTLMEMPNLEFYHHPVEKEKFDLKRLEKIIFLAHDQNPQNFEGLLKIKGVGPRTIRALSLVSELIYGAKPSYQDPARYSFAVGGKDGTPFPVDRVTYNQALEVMEKGIKKSNIRYQEKLAALERLDKFS
ncbi:MAG: DUF763 domain-containing protein [Candidatus Portnoybacteria bacterium]|nr:DUF763 domain-containing protein [Candidatus Portnoybacteria bacterium]